MHPLLFMCYLINFIVLTLLPTAMYAQTITEDKSFRDPFIPLYVIDPKNDFEKRLAKRVKYNDASNTLPQMYVCKSSGANEKKYVMYADKVYYVGDRYLSGVIEDINCDHITIRSEDTTIILRLFDDDIITEAGEKENV